MARILPLGLLLAFLAPDLVAGPPPPRNMAPGARSTTAAPQDKGWVRVKDADLDLRALTKRGKQVLAIKDMGWKHAQTEHFVIHYERSTFAKRVGDMGEFLYGYISKDLKAPEDRTVGRSHVFVFRNPERWKQFQEASPTKMEWAYSMVEGTVMYLQEAEEKDASASVLAHEMTHLVLNRFFPARIPLWLNEGLAEWYGETGYSAFKGIRRRRSSQFRDLENAYPVAKLLDADDYPQGSEAVNAYYDTAKHVVGYLRLEHGEENFAGFLSDVMAGDGVPPALEKRFGLSGYKALQAGFQKFLR